MQADLCKRGPMSDGVELATDVWLPSGPGPFPVLFTRTPYHRRSALGGARRYTSEDYAFVTQDCRGKYDSDGAFHPLVDEARDGQDTIAWIADQSFCNGRVGMVGRSYLGIVQIPAAAGAHDALKCIVPGVAPTSFFTDWIRYDGCFAFANAIRWALSHAVCRTQPQYDHAPWADLHQLRTLGEIEERLGFRSPELREWVAHDTYDDYWQAIDQHRMYEHIAVPGMHVGGWFDHLTRGQFQSFAEIGQHGATDLARASQRLYIGPWGHSTIGQHEYGQWNFGPSAAADTLAYERRFLDLWLRDIDDGITEEPPVRVFLMGENRWVNLGSWPPPGVTDQEWNLRSGGAANGIGSDGRLARDEPGDEPPDRYTYDPLNPVPTHGGPIYWGLAAAGPVDQREILSRDDVLYYRGPVLDDNLTVAGDVNLDLWIASDAHDTDYIAKLCVVEPGGRVIVLGHGSLRCRYRHGWSDVRALDANQPTQIRINLGNLAYVFPRGSRVSLIITSSCFPRILPHPNTMTPTWQETDPRPASNQVIHDLEHKSVLHLPVIEDGLP